MKALFKMVLVVMCLFSVVGCEDDGRHQDYSYQNYNDESYVSVSVRNDYWAYINILVGNAEYDQVPPGQERWVSRSLIGREKLKISIVFFDENGHPIAQSKEYSFDRDYNEYHMVARSPYEKIRVY